MPFLRTCSDKSIERYTPEVVTSEIKVDETKTLSNEVEIQNLQNKREENIIENKKDNTFNFYKLINYTLVQKESKFYLNKSILQDKTFFPLFGFLLILIVSVLLLIFSFAKKYKLIYVFGILNFILLFLSTLTLIISGIVENINQFKIGYYLFALNSILIILTAKKDLKKLPFTVL